MSTEDEAAVRAEALRMALQLNPHGQVDQVERDALRLLAFMLNAPKETVDAD
jgi:hypothetical protein